MCHQNLRTFVHPDGRQEYTYQPAMCSAARRTGAPCVSYYSSPSAPSSAASSTYLSPHSLSSSPFPPTPSYTPRSSTPASYHYRSGDESDKSYGSYHSGASSSSKKKSRRHSVVYYNGQVVSESPSRHRSEREQARRDRERIVIVDNPPTARTPPRPFATPYTAPSSPSPRAPSPPPHYAADGSPRHGNYIYSSSSRHNSSSSSRRPVIVDERPRVEIEVVNTQPRSKHSRHASSSSHESRQSFSSSSAEGKRPNRGDTRRDDKQATKVRSRIDKANAEILNRPAVPVSRVPRLVKRESTGSTTAATMGTNMARPSVQVPTATTTASPASSAAELEERIRRLELGEGSRHAARRADKQVGWDDDSQRQRMKERAMPERRATVGPGSRRRRETYDDRMYRWE